MNDCDLKEPLFKTLVVEQRNPPKFCRHRYTESIQNLDVTAKVLFVGMFSPILFLLSPISPCEACRSNPPQLPSMRPALAAAGERGSSCSRRPMWQELRRKTEIQKTEFRRPGSLLVFICIRVARTYCRYDSTRLRVFFHFPADILYFFCIRTFLPGANSNNLVWHGNKQDTSKHRVQ